MNQSPVPIPLQDVNSYASLFRSLALPQLLDSSLRQMYQEHPVNAREALRLFLDITNKEQNSYYSMVVDQFEKAVEQLERCGFNAVSFLPATLHFSIPLSDGGLFELFPYSKELEVTPNNYDNFVALRALYQKSVAQNNFASYDTDALPFLPLNAYSQLLGHDFMPALDFIEEYLLGSSHSQWRITLEGQWDALEITRAVPYSGRLFPVEKGTSVNVHVRFSEAILYVRKARARLTELKQLVARGASLNEAYAMPPVPPAKQVVCHSVDDTEHMAMMDTAGVSSSMTEAEKDFWRSLEKFSRSPCVPPNEVSFLLKLPYANIPLKENGEYIAVNEQNVHEFVELVKRNREKVHRAFMDNCEQSLSQQHPVEQRNPGETYLDRYSPERSPTWNTTALSVKDLGSDFFKSTRHLREQFLAGCVGANDWKLREQRTFHIPCIAGTYDLIPNGRHIKVTQQNAEEYFKRVDYEYEKLEKIRASQISGQGSAEQRAQSVPLTPRPPSSAHEKRNGSFTTTAMERGMSDAVTTVNIAPTSLYKKTSSEMSSDAFLTKDDLPFLADFEAYSRSLLEANDVMTDGLDHLNLFWNIVIPDKNYSISLRPNGSRLRVQPSEFLEYLRAIITKVDEIRTAINRTGRYPPVPLHTYAPHKSPAAERHAISGSEQRVAGAQFLRVQQEMENSMHLRDTAIPMQPTAAETAMFSPTHTTGNLFSPPQHISM